MQTHAPNNPCSHQEQDLQDLAALYQAHQHQDPVQDSRNNWQQHYQLATGAPPAAPEDADDLFVRHTCINLLTLLALQVGYGLPVTDMAPQDLLEGHTLAQTTGLTNITTSHHLDWPLYARGAPVIHRIAQRMHRTRPDVQAMVSTYQNLVPARIRSPQGEHQTPLWLAEMILQELRANPLDQSVIDPTCGAGACVAAAVNHHQEAARQAGMTPQETLRSLQEMTAGLELNPAALGVARAAWALAAQPSVQATARDQPTPNGITIPVWQGDSLQPGRASPGHQDTPPDTVTITLLNTAELQADLTNPTGTSRTTAPGTNRDITLPTSIARNPEAMADLLNQASDLLRRGRPTAEALASIHLPNPSHRDTLAASLRTIEQVHQQHGAGAWEPQLRRLIHPMALSLAQRDIILGNPPWITYHQAGPALKQQLRHLGQDIYHIWQGAHHATQQDAAGITFARCVHLYLRPTGTIAMVMPRSALKGAQFARWRSGTWSSPRKPGSNQPAFPSLTPPTLSVDFSAHQHWDLTHLVPGTAFPVPASVVFARKNSHDQQPVPLRGPVQAWRQTPGHQTLYRESQPLHPEDDGRRSPYAQHTRSGATIYPRRLFYVLLAEPYDQSFPEQDPHGDPAETVPVRDAPTRLEKPPWNQLSHQPDTRHPVEIHHLFRVHTGSTIAPHITLSPPMAALPASRTRDQLVKNPRGPGGIDPESLGTHMRNRWERTSLTWEQHRKPLSPEDLARRLDYHQGLSAQLDWQKDPRARPMRVAYTQAGRPTAALLPDPHDLVDYRLAWVTCTSTDEAHYLTAIINSDTLREAVTPLMSQGNYGPRDLDQGLWRLPIPAFDTDQTLHRELAQAGAALKELAQQILVAHHPAGSAWTSRKTRSLLQQQLPRTDIHQHNEKAVAALLEQESTYFPKDNSPAGRTDQTGAPPGPRR